MELAAEGIKPGGAYGIVTLSGLETTDKAWGTAFARIVYALLEYHYDSNLQKSS